MSQTDFIMTEKCKMYDLDPFQLKLIIKSGEPDMLVRQIDSLKNTSGSYWPAQSRRKRIRWKVDSFCLVDPGLRAFEIPYIA